MSKLAIANGVSLPLDTVTQAIGILAKRRAGKSYLARRLVEQLLRAEQQVVIVDPKGDWWGIRSAADGKGPGLKVTILGGEHADVPLEHTSGELVAHLVVEERVSILLDLSLFSKAQVATFMAAFLETVYRLKAQEQYRTPVMLVIDEADAIAPQKPMKGTSEERMLGAANDIVRRGGQRGIGCIMVTQRSAVLSKNVLTQIELLITLKTIAPQDLAAINDWIDVHGTKEQRDLLMETLPALPVGTAWFWSPAWPTDKGIFQKAEVLPIETFDSGATPKPGHKQSKPKTMADVDLDAFRKRMVATIEKAKQEDPRELRKEIADLKGQLKKLQATAAPPPVVERIEVPVLTKEDRTLVCDLGADIEDIVAKWKKAEQMLVAAAEKMLKGVASSGSANGILRADHVLRSRPATLPKKAAAAKAPAALEPDDGGELPTMDRRFLVALAQQPWGRTKKHLLAIAGYRDGGATSRSLSRLKRLNHIVVENDLYNITHAGLAALGSYEQLPTGAALFDYWSQKVPIMPRAMLCALREAGPLSKRDLLGVCNYQDGGATSRALRLLRALNLVVPPKGDPIDLNRELFA